MVHSNARASEVAEIETDAGPPRADDEPETFEEFYDREFTAVVALAYVLSGSRSGAEDIAQEAFIATHRQWRRVGRFERPDAWVRRVAANLSVSSVRRRLAEGRALLRVASLRPPPLPAPPSETHEFWSAVRSLPKRQAQVVALFYLEDLAVARIAEVLEMAEGTVKAHLHAGRRSLAARLQLDDEEDA